LCKSLRCSYPTAPSWQRTPPVHGEKIKISGAKKEKSSRGRLTSVFYRAAMHQNNCLSSSASFLKLTLFSFQMHPPTRCMSSRPYRNTSLGSSLSSQYLPSTYGAYQRHGTKSSWYQIELIECQEILSLPPTTSNQSTKRGNNEPIIVSSKEEGRLALEL
jgi:hypothetical protein